jgi:DNA polymerase-3 subunit delta
MLLRVDALEAHLARPLGPLYTITSDEHLLAQEAADRIRRTARAQGYSEREVLTVDRSFKWGALLAASQEQSLFGDRKLIELRIPTGKPGKEGGQALQEFAKSIRPGESDTIVLVTLPKLDWATQKAAWVAPLQQASVYIDIARIERAQLPAWIGVRLAAQRQSADKQGLDFIADRVEGNLLAAHQEIQKLGLLHPEGKLSFEQIHDAVLNVARYDVFKLNEAMLVGDTARLVRMVEGLKGEGEALPLVLWAVAEEIRMLLRLKAGAMQGRPVGAMLKEYRVWGPRERLMEPALRRLELSVLERALHEAAQVDRMIKGLRARAFAGNAWDAMLQLALRIAGPGQVLRQVPQPVRHDPRQP